MNGTVLETEKRTSKECLLSLYLQGQNRFVTLLHSPAVFPINEAFNARKQVSPLLWRKIDMVGVRTEQVNVFFRAVFLFPTIAPQ
jgi:hypothetical protein